MSPDVDTVVFLIPAGHLRRCMDAEQVSASAYLRDRRTHDDPVLQASMARLAFRSAHDDASVFDRRTLANLVEYIDGHLRIEPSLGDMALQTGLSPSHFAKNSGSPPASACTGSSIVGE